MLADVSETDRILYANIDRLEGGGYLWVGTDAWCPPSLLARLDEHFCAPCAAPDADQLERHMFEAEAPYDKHVARDSLSVVAKSRSAAALASWLEQLIDAASPQRYRPRRS